MYEVKAGDTFSVISRKVYGVEDRAGVIQKANPGASEPLTPGTVLAIPPDPDVSNNRNYTAPAANVDEVILQINKKRFRFWNSLRLIRAIDTMDVAEFGAPFDPNEPAFRETFRPFLFQDVTILVGGAVLFTGTLVAVNPESRSTGRSVNASCYSRPGVLQDCTAPASDLTKQWNGVGLQGIAQSLAAPFGIGVVFGADQGPVFESVAIDTAGKVLPFLTSLAKQRNLLISSSELGGLQFLSPKESGQPVAVLQDGESPLLSVTPFFNPQEYYSHVTGIEPVVSGLAGSQFTVKNPFLPGVVRPFAFNAPDTETADIKTATESKAGRMFGNFATYTVEVSTWRDPAGALWTPNTLIKLTAPGAMVYEPYTFLIRSVEFTRSQDRGGTAVLSLVIPGVFNGKIPGALPWAV